MKEIKLRDGEIVLVDDEDFEWLNRWRWKLENRSNKYACRFDSTIRNTILMHRIIMQTPKGKQTDHINHNGLDNRKENLRVCTCAENSMNQNIQKRNKYGYKGIRKIGKKWQAYITLNKKWIHIGVYLSAEDAAKAYDKTAISLFGDFAKANFG
jgi:hypothetical protein